MVSNLKNFKTTDDLEKSLGALVMKLIINDQEVENMLAAF